MATTVNRSGRFAWVNNAWRLTLQLPSSNSKGLSLHSSRRRVGSRGGGIRSSSAAPARRRASSRRVRSPISWASKWRVMPSAGGVQRLQQDQRCLRCSLEHLCAGRRSYLVRRMYLGKRGCVRQACSAMRIVSSVLLCRATCVVLLSFLGAP